MIVSRRDKWRIGSVPYVGARPLDYGLDRRRDVALIRATPSQLTAMLEADELDAALLPTIAYFRLTAEALERHRHRPLVILPVGALASRGPVGSVLLLCRREIDLLRHVALDPASQSANCMVRLVLKELYQTTPHFRWPTPDPDALDTESDGLLMIGDAALRQDSWDYYRVLDLGEAWQRLTRQPFVYAAWTARDADDLPHLAGILAEARQRGSEAIDELVRTESRRTDLADDVVRRHLAEQLVYDLGPDELAGLHAFYRRAAEEELAPQQTAIRLLTADPPGDEAKDTCHGPPKSR
jgi:chorismate dehydratase